MCGYERRFRCWHWCGYGFGVGTGIGLGMPLNMPRKEGIHTGQLYLCFCRILCVEAQQVLHVDGVLVLHALPQPASDASHHWNDNLVQVRSLPCLFGVHVSATAIYLTTRCLYNQNSATDNVNNVPEWLQLISDIVIGSHWRFLVSLIWHKNLGHLSGRRHGSAETPCCAGVSQ